MKTIRKGDLVQVITGADRGKQGRVIALDVGHGQLHEKLRQDERVLLLERCNARALRADCPPAWRERLAEGVEPVQWIRYMREYWVTGDRAVRITLDRELQTFDQRTRRRLSSKFPTPNRRLLVIEDDLRFARILLDMAHERGFKVLAAGDGASGSSATQERGRRWPPFRRQM